MKRNEKRTLRSNSSTQGRLMAGARALWRANGMKEEQMGKPIIAVVNSFTQFVPGHAHLHEIGQLVKAEIEQLGCFAAEFNTIAVDDGIAMGHDGMLYSLPSRDMIADSIEYMINAHKVDAMVCISNCDKITPGMLMAAMRLNIPAIFVSGDRWRQEDRRRVDRPDRRDDRIGRRQCLRPAHLAARKAGLPHLRLLLRHVHRQLDELPQRTIGLACPATEPSSPPMPTGSTSSARRRNRLWRTPTATTSRATRACCREA